MGFDTDPAQIVNMALALSEGRRRYLSNPRVPPVDSSKRMSSQSGYNTRLLQDRRHGNLGQYLTSQREASWNTSPKAPNFGRREPRPPSATFPQSSYDDPVSEQDVQEGLEDGEGSLNVSEATYARAEKAKVHLELLYEYRRLLQHLPPLKPPAPAGTMANGRSEGRTYNTLQYVRNRKVRFREKQPIHSEREGWYDVEKVRSWVDSIEETDRDDLWDANACVRLPKLQGQSSWPTYSDDGTSQTSAPSSQHWQDKANTRPRRPRLDWVVHPGDLIADAYWLEQGLNKTKIEDRDGNKVYPANTEFKFTGWSRGGQGAKPEDLPHVQLDTAAQMSDQNQPHSLPELPNFQSTKRERSGDRRGHKHKSLRKSVAKGQENSIPLMKKRKKGLGVLANPLKGDSSDTMSSSEQGNFRGRQRKQRDKDMNHGIDNAALEKQMLAMLEKEPQEQAIIKTPSFSEESAAEALGQTAKNGALVEEAGPNQTPQNPTSLQTRKDSIDPKVDPDGENLPRDSIEDTTTSPNSPVMNSFPSIAINLSPPQSRSPSPAKKPFPKAINFFRHERTKSQDRAGISTADFASPTRPTHSRSPSIEAASRRSTAPSPMDSREHSPFSKVNIASEDPAPVTLRRARSNFTKGAGKPPLPDQPSRIRGMFKGGRIAELVGNEVSRVGDFIWKRDLPGAQSPGSSDVEFSDAEPGLKTPPRANLRRLQASPKEGIPLSRQSTRTEKIQPQYNFSNLPSFTSPFKKDQDTREKEREQQSSDTSPPQDLAALNDRRGSSRSDRLQRLAPPRLDINASSDDLRGENGDDSRRSSVFGGPLELVPSRDHMNGRPRTGRYTAMPVTGLHAIPPTSSRSRERNKGLNGIIPRSPSRSRPTGRVSHAELSRVRTLLLTSAVKAREVNRRANTIRDPPPKFLLDALESSRSPGSPTSPPPLPPIPRKEEYLHASKLLLQSIASSTDTIRSHLSHFSTSTVPNLHRSLGEIEDLLENSLTPRVRTAADSAGELSQSLTTTSTLAVKQLNDAVDVAARRRRRGLFGGPRLIRMLMYRSLEGIVVGILWCVWGVVSLVRFVRGVIRLLFKVLRWLFWL